MSFWSIPDKTSIASTFIFTFLFCLPFAGSEDLFLFAVAGQVLTILLVWLLFRKDYPSLLQQCSHSLPKTMLLLASWLIATLVSLGLVFTGNANGWQKAFAIARELFILIQVAYCLSLMRFILVSRTSFMRLLLGFCLGFAGISFLHFALLYWGPACDSETWLKEPFLSPNMRDIGDLASAAIAITCAAFCHEQKRWQSLALLGLFTISWTYLLWSGGRTAIVAALAVNLAILWVCRTYHRLPLNKMALSGLAIIIAYLLCVQLSIYDWNGIVRYSSEWQQNASEFKGDMTSGRMEMWKWSIQAFMQHPWFGLGPFGFYFIPERFAQQFWHDHPHNLLIQSLVEWGIVGTALFLGLLAALAWAGIRKIRIMAASGNQEFLASAGVVLVLTLGSLTGGSYWDFQPVIILVTAFACFPHLSYPQHGPGRN